VLFCNTTLNNQTLFVGQGSSISGNTLTLNKNFSGLGGELGLKIYNYTTVATSGNIIKATIGGIGVETDEIFLASYSNSGGTPAPGEISITAVSSIINIKFEESKPFYFIEYSFSSDLKIPNINKVIQNGSVNIKLESLEEGTSAGVPDVTGICNSTYDVVSSILTLSNVKSNIRVILNEVNPWTYGRYISGTGSETPPSEVMEDGASVVYDAFAGWPYVKFKNHTIQESSLFKSVAGDIPARWIVIGKNMGETLLTGPAVKSEIDSGCVLLFSEQTLTNMPFDDSDGNWSDSSLRNWLNGEFLVTSGLNAYKNDFIQNVISKTSFQGNALSGDANDSIQDNIFLLSTHNGMNTEVGSGTSYYSSYVKQSFIIEDYLGRASSSNQKIMNFIGKNSAYYWLRSGVYNKIDCAYAVDDMGYIANSRKVTSTSYGVRPAFVLNLA
ncbi:MAG: hypothetical protein IKT27_05175, partial [Clostridia bacterium]|nr:hypothetical protein [Clostridia bacterium]